MRQDHAPHTDLRKAGLAAALVVGVLLAAGLAVVALTRRPPAPRAAPGSLNTGVTPEVPPDVVDRGISTKTARVQFADKKDPGRAAGMIEWASLDPISPTEKLLTEPRGYIYLRDGGVVLVASHSGRLSTTPKIEEPQSGRFEGNVTLKLFPAGTDPKADAPTLTAASESLDFDFPSASISTTGPFTVRSTGFDIDGSGMRLIVNQLEEGVERFEVARIKQVVIRPDARDPLGSNGLTGDKPARATPGTVKGPDRHRTYHAVIDGGFKLAQAARTITGDRAEVWAALVNNRLAPGSIGHFGPNPQMVGSCPDTGAENVVLEAVPDGAPKPQPPAPTPTADSTIRATWGGKMVVTPVPEIGEGAIPAELSGNKVALRIHGDQNPAVMQDEAFKGSMKAARVDLGATTRTVALASSPAHKVAIDTASAGSLTASAATVDMGAGKVVLTGPGRLLPAGSVLSRGVLAKPGEAPPETTLDFNKTLDLSFRTLGDFITSDAKSANISGGFKARSGDVTAEADQATVLFGRRVNDRNPIDELVLRGNAVASAPAIVAPVPAGTPGRGAPAKDARDTLKGQKMTFRFESDAPTATERPTSIEVAGNAEATAGGSGDSALSLKADQITARLGKAQSGQIAVTSAEALDNVHVTDNPGGGQPTLVASADKLTVDPAAGVAFLYGKPVTVSRDGAVMTGATLRLTQATGQVFVDGPGTVTLLTEPTYDKSVPPKVIDPGTSAFASWQTSMTFDNAKGHAECVGDASALLTRGDIQRDQLQAETVILNFSPAPQKGEPSAQRELLNAEAIGLLGVDGKPPRPATLEHRQFSTPGGVQRLDQLVYLEGHRILADQTKRTLDVPTAGKLLVDDRTTDPAHAPAAPVDAPINPLGGFASGKGVSLFTWNGSLHLSLDEGRAVLSKDVALIHQSLPSGAQPSPPQTTLDCDTLTAHLVTKPAAPGASPADALAKLDATLKSVEAVGDVVAKSEGRQLTAHSVTFDTIMQYIEAAGDATTSSPLATFLDPSRPAPIRARKFSWDQKNGEIRIIEPAPTTIGH